MYTYIDFETSTDRRAYLYNVYTAVNNLFHFQESYSKVQHEVTTEQSLFKSRKLVLHT